MGHPAAALSQVPQVPQAQRVQRERNHQYHNRQDPALEQPVLYPWGPQLPRIHQGILPRHNSQEAEVALMVEGAEEAAEEVEVEVQPRRPSEE